jgi:hypothetical protein
VCGEKNEIAIANPKPTSDALRVTYCLPAHALPAPIARIIALTAPKTLGLSGTPFHEPFHGRGVADIRRVPVRVSGDLAGVVDAVVVADHRGLG